MESGLMFLDCPAYRGRAGGERCGLPAEVRSRFTGPLESLTLTTGPGRAAAAPCPAGKGGGRAGWPP
jgi:hypothetical protein